MRRRAPTEVVEPFRRRKALQVATGLHEALAAWAKSNLDRLADAEPEMPPGLVDRPADVWEALLAVADLAGGSWSADARKAALELNRARIEADPSLGIALLRDIRTVFGNTDGLPTEELLRRLCALDESPWGDLRGKPLDARGWPGGSAPTRCARPPSGSATRPPRATGAPTSTTPGPATFLSPKRPQHPQQRNNRRSVAQRLLRTPLRMAWPYPQQPTTP
jgi:hypothetical protein